MNKQQAKQYAYRLLVGLIEEQFGSQAPLVYDELCATALRGRRLSPADSQRVEEALEALSDDFERRDGKIGDLENPRLPPRDKRGRFMYVQADGKPGSKWKGYGAWLKLQGRQL